MAFAWTGFASFDARAASCLSISGSTSPVPLGATLQFSAQCCAATPALSSATAWALGGATLVLGLLATGRVGRKAARHNLFLLVLFELLALQERPVSAQSCGGPFHWTAQSGPQQFTGTGPTFSFTPTSAGTFVVTLQDATETATATVSVLANALCGATSASLAWTASVPSVQPSLALVDVVAGPTDDVIVGDRVGAGTFEQRRWSSAGAFLSTHQDQSGAFAGTLYTSGLFADPGNGIFYGLLLTGGPSNGVNLLWNRVNASGALDFSSANAGTVPAPLSPSVTSLRAGGDSANFHGAFVMTPPSLAAGVYSYANDGTALGVSAVNVTSLLTSQDFVWPTPDAGLALFKRLTVTTNFGCSSALNVPAAGGVGLVKFTGSGSCLWNKLLNLPTAALQTSNFRVGADGSLLVAAVYAGTIDFGSGPLTSAGQSSLALARFDGSTGNLLWAKSFGGAGSSLTIGSVGANAAGNVILTGGYAGTVDLGGGLLPTSNDSFLAVFTSAGVFKWSRTVSVGGQGQLLGAAGTCGLVFATNSPNVNFGAGPLSTVTNGIASIGVGALGL
jgi:hypothetical protein